MGKGANPKSKEKRLARKTERKRIQLAQTIVDKANRLKDPFEPFGAFRKYCKNGIDAQLYIKRVTDLNEDVKDWVFDLTKRNMQQKYEECSWGWKDKEKLEEMMDDAAWYLIATSCNGELLGFSHFRFDLDECLEVLYCYELQLESTVLRKGLGKFMMQILELIAFTNQMRKVVLTILKNNENSEFFSCLNYMLDESSPTEEELESCPYKILSKCNRKLLETNSSKLSD